MNHSPEDTFRDRDRARVRQELQAMSQARAPEPSAPPRHTSVLARIFTSVVATVTEGWGTQQELQERLIILNRPWQHDQAHWVPAPNGNPQLHGTIPPPRGGTGPVTATGWCPCHLLTPAAQTTPYRLVGESCSPTQPVTPDRCNTR